MAVQPGNHKDAKPGRRFFATMAGRLMVSAILWAVAALTIGGFILSFAFRSYALTDVDKRLELLLNTIVGVSEVTPEGTLRLNPPLADQRFLTPYSGWYWQVNDDGQQIIRSQSLWDFEFQIVHQKPSFQTRFTEVEGPDGQRLRMAEDDVILPEVNRAFHYQVATDMAEVQAAIDRFNWLLFAALALILLTVTLAVVLQVIYGLRPLRAIRRDLADVRAGRAQRLEGKDDEALPEDLQPLVDEINGLIDQNDRLVQRARTHVGNLAHALKTPLTVIQNSAAELPDAQAELIGKQAKDIRVHIDHHLKRARIAGGGTGNGLPVKDRLSKLARAATLAQVDKDLIIDIECNEAFLFDGEKEDFDELLGNLIDNAAKWAKKRVDIQVEYQEQGLRRPMIEILVGDDGDGVPEDQRAQLFERGRRLDEHVPGTGLGLAIVQDIAEMYGGSVQLETAKLGGLAACLRLPAKQSGIK